MSEIRIQTILFKMILSNIVKSLSTKEQTKVFFLLVTKCIAIFCLDLKKILSHWTSHWYNHGQILINQYLKHTRLLITTKIRFI